MGSLRLPRGGGGIITTHSLKLVRLGNMARVWEGVHVILRHRGVDRDKIVCGLGLKEQTIELRDRTSILLKGGPLIKCGGYAAHCLPRPSNKY